MKIREADDAIFTGFVPTRLLASAFSGQKERELPAGRPPIQHLVQMKKYEHTNSVSAIRNLRHLQF